MTQKITGTREAFAKMLEEKNIHEKLGVERPTVSTWKTYMKPESKKGITEDKMKEMLFKYGARLIKEPVYELPVISQ